MSTCNQLDLQTLGSQPIMSKNLTNQCTTYVGVHQVPNLLDTLLYVKDNSKNELPLDIDDQYTKNAYASKGTLTVYLNSNLYYFAILKKWKSNTSMNALTFR